MKEWRTPI